MNVFIWWVQLVGLMLWVLFAGPLWLVGWGVLHAAKCLNRAASIWCWFLLSLMPEPGNRE